MSFEKSFVQGIEFRSHFDAQFSLDTDACMLLEATFEKTNDQAMQEPFFSIRQQVCAHAKVFADQKEVKPFAYQCLADCHVFLEACIKHEVVQKKYMTLTVGDVTFKDTRLFNTTRNTLQNAITTGISTQDVPQFHVWLTLADMTVIDFSINRYLNASDIDAKPHAARQSPTIWRPDCKRDINYLPVLVDDDFLYRLQKPLQ
jgi:hypothetical protein